MILHAITEAGCKSRIIPTTDFPSLDLTGELRVVSLQCRQNECDSVPNHRRVDCLLNSRSKKKALRRLPLCEGNSPVTSEFPTQRASNTENAPIWWRHHALVGFEESWWRFNDTTQYWTIWNGSMWIILLYQWKPKLNSLLSILRFLQNILTMIITTKLLNCNYGRKRTDAKYMYKKIKSSRNFGFIFDNPRQCIVALKLAWTMTLISMSHLRLFVLRWRALHSCEGAPRAQWAAWQMPPPLGNAGISSIVEDQGGGGGLAC